MIAAFEFTSDGRDYRCQVEERSSGLGRTAWWWFGVSGDRSRYAPFRAEAAKLLPMADYIVSNETEFDLYAEALKLSGRDRAARMHAVQVPVAYGRFRVVTPAFVRRCHAAGLHVHVWTINERDEMNRLLDLGVDGIMTDQADVLAQVMDERGFWPQREQA
mgnify:CR=1 FL=1